MPIKAKASWFVYIVSCADDSLYTGITIDIERRVDEHNFDNVKCAKYTRARRPVTLVYSESLESRQMAAVREYAIKKMSRQQKIRLIEDTLHA